MGIAASAWTPRPWVYEAGPRSGSLGQNGNDGDGDMVCVGGFALSLFLLQRWARKVELKVKVKSSQGERQLETGP